jgi:hypothetical protein
MSKSMRFKTSNCMPSKIDEGRKQRKYLRTVPQGKKFLRNASLFLDVLLIDQKDHFPARRKQSEYERNVRTAFPVMLMCRMRLTVCWTHMYSR